MLQKRAKAWDMNFHWIQDQAVQDIFEFFWDKGKNNDADYYTKNQPPNYHQNIQPTCILKNHLMRSLKVVLALF